VVKIKAKKVAAVEIKVKKAVVVATRADI